MYLHQKKLISLLQAYEGHASNNNVIGFRSHLRVTHQIVITIVFK